MMNSVDFKHLPIQDLVISRLIIFIISTIIANIYDPLLGITYVFTNILTLTFWVGYKRDLEWSKEINLIKTKDKFKTTSVFLILKNTLN